MFFLLAIAALVVAAFANPIAVNNRPIFPDGRIIGGENAVIESYPYQISLQLFGSHHCGGSIISANYVVTAGHCALPGFHSDFTVRAGSSFREQGGSVHEIVEIVRHDKFDWRESGVPLFDIAVLKVKEPFVFDETRQPINLFDASEESLSEVDAVVTGWGVLSQNGTDLPLQLQAVTIPIVSKDLCDTAYKQSGGLPEGQICASYYGVGGKDHCYGDSGGPLAINGRLAGIVSWSEGCAEADYPGVYTEVAYVREWINEHVTF